MTNSFTDIGHVSTGNIAIPKEVVDFLQLAQPDDLEGSVDETAAEEVNSFARLLAVSDIAALDGSQVGHGWEDGYA